ncbi:biotin/lipoyl-containing protein [Maricaulis sp.]|uniref:biotin/lipoyl-containing protein n=1 Tax=Maricaulis sp. TaxID=1486257 RepID=UPI0025B8A05A|nr:biotin/lipoyl-containing protein [Maricaulis sp.]
MPEGLVPVTLPKLGLTMESGSVSRWLRKEGESVRVGEHLFDVQTSKSANECEAPAGGILARIVVGTGIELPVGALIGVIATGKASEADLSAFITNYQPQTKA